MICPNCGESMPDTMLFCGKCGTKLASDIQSSSETPVEPIPAEPVPVNPIPAEQIPVAPVPVNPIPAEQIPVAPVPVEPVPAESAPIEPNPVDPNPTSSAPVNPAPMTAVPVSPLPKTRKWDVKTIIAAAILPVIWIVGIIIFVSRGPSQPSDVTTLPDGTVVNTEGGSSPLSSKTYTADGMTTTYGNAYIHVVGGETGGDYDQLAIEIPSPTEFDSGITFSYDSKSMSAHESAYLAQQEGALYFSTQYNEDHIDFPSFTSNYSDALSKLGYNYAMEEGTQYEHNVFYDYSGNQEISHNAFFDSSGQPHDLLVQYDYLGTDIRVYTTLEAAPTEIWSKYQQSDHEDLEITENNLYYYGQYTDKANNLFDVIAVYWTNNEGKVDSISMMFPVELQTGDDIDLYKITNLYAVIDYQVGYQQFQQFSAKVVEKTDDTLVFTMNCYVKGIVGGHKLSILAAVNTTDKKSYSPFEDDPQNNNGDNQNQQPDNNNGNIPSGGGTTLCSACKGNGQVECHSCGGDGFDLCPNCHGTGNRLVDDENGVYDTLLCNRCTGAGQIKCSKCNGTVKVTCTLCRGSGTQQEVLT